MIVEFTIHSPAPLVVTATLANDSDAWRLLDILSLQRWPVTHRVLSRAPSGFPSILKVRA